MLIFPDRSVRFQQWFIPRISVCLIGLIGCSVFLTVVEARQSSVERKTTSIEKKLARQAALFKDSDGDGLADELEDKIGTEKYLDDTDGDGINDRIEVGENKQQPLNTDNDAYIDALDIDDDNDGLPTVLETAQDIDKDQRVNYLDTDSDNDGVTDGIEAGMSGKDIDNDMIDDAFSADAVNAIDNNGDGIRDDFKLPDMNKNSLADVWEPAYRNYPVKFIKTHALKKATSEVARIKSVTPKQPHAVVKLSVDAQEKAIKTLVASKINQPLTRENDRDNDGLLNSQERVLGTDPDKRDSDQDKVSDAIEIGLDLDKPQDSDGDGVIDALDNDDDNDGVLTALEDLNKDGSAINDDTDNDGVPNYLDANDDGDSRLTREEGYSLDSDNDGIPDYLDKNDGVSDITKANKNEMITPEKPELVMVYEDQLHAVNGKMIDVSEAVNDESGAVSGINHISVRDNEERRSTVIAARNAELSKGAPDSDKPKTGFFNWLTSLLPD